MSRSDYSEDCDDNWSWIKFRGWVASATRGKRGQAFYRDLLAALDAMPAKRLITDALECDGEFCAIGALGHARGVDMSRLNADNSADVGIAFNINQRLAQEVVYMNDEAYDEATPELRWCLMRSWVASQILAP